MADTVIVKKYSNRRLYDTEDSRYLTLDELAKKIRSGTDIRVIDAKSGNDLTQATLTQIIIEGRGAGRLLPVPLLMQLIRLDDEALAEFMGRYIGSTLELYMQAKRGAQMMQPFNPFATLPFSAGNAIARLFVGQTTPEPAPVTPPPTPDPEPKVDEMAELRREIEALKEAVAAKK